MCVNGYPPFSLWFNLLCKKRNRHIFLEEWLKPKEGIKCPSESIHLRAKVPLRIFFFPSNWFLTNGEHCELRYSHWILGDLKTACKLLPKKCKMEAKMGKHIYNLILKLHNFYIYMYVRYFCNVHNHVIISVWNDMAFKFLGCFVSSVSQWSGWSLLAHNSHWNLFATSHCRILWDYWEVFSMELQLLKSFWLKRKRVFSYEYHME